MVDLSPGFPGSSERLERRVCLLVNRACKDHTTSVFLLTAVQLYVNMEYEYANNAGPRVYAGRPPRHERDAGG